MKKAQTLAFVISALFQSVAQGQSESMQQRGVSLRQEVLEHSMAVLSKGTVRLIDLTDICAAAIPQATPLENVYQILRGAGVNFPLLSTRNRSGNVDSPDRNDIGGGFKFPSSSHIQVGYTIFQISIRPDLTSNNLEKVVACVVLTKYL